MRYAFHIKPSPTNIALLVLALLFTTTWARSGASNEGTLITPVSSSVSAGTETSEQISRAQLSGSNAVPSLDMPLICLSPGHPSSEGDKYFEAILNRKVAWFLAIQLIEADFDVMMAIEDVPPQKLFFSGLANEDEQLWSFLKVATPEEKANRCNDADADYLISIHHNYAYSPVTNQTMVFYTMDENYRPVFGEARHWAETTAAQLGRVMETDESYAIADLERVGFPLGILANADMPAILTEASFYSNAEERNRLNDDFYLSSEAEAIFRAFTDHMDSRPATGNGDSKE